jgi:hypothetical protein
VVKSAFRAERLHTEEPQDDSFYQMQDYTSNNNSVAYGVPKKGVLLIKPKIKKAPGKKTKLTKGQHFMSYDVRSSLNKYELVNQPNLIDTSMDKGNSKSKKKM